MKVRFEKRRVMFHDNPAFSFNIKECRFEVRMMDAATKEPAYSCS
jgi:hypothetical protein